MDEEGGRKKGEKKTRKMEIGNNNKVTFGAMLQLSRKGLAITIFGLF